MPYAQAKHRFSPTDAFLGMISAKYHWLLHQLNPYSVRWEIENWGKLILLKNRTLDNEWSFVSKFLQRWGRIGANTASSLLEWLLCTCTRKELAVVKSEFSNSLKSQPRRWTLLITQVSYGSSCLVIGRHDGCLSSTSSFTRDGSL